MSTLQISIILPTYNEVDNIPLVVDGIMALPGSERFEVLVVDDDSPDGTGDAVRELMEIHPNLSLLTRTEDKGLVPALRDGVKAARGDVCLWMDADMSMPPSFIPMLIEAVENGADLAFGSRYIPGGGIKGCEPAKREKTPLLQVWRNVRDSEDSFISIMISKAGNNLMRFLLSPSLHDYTSGFFAARRTLLDDVGIRGIFVDYCIILSYNSLKKGYKVVELPLVVCPRRHGCSKTSNTLFSVMKVSFQCITAALRLRLKG